MVLSGSMTTNDINRTCRLMVVLAGSWASTNMPLLVVIETCRTAPAVMPAKDSGVSLAIPAHLRITRNLMPNRA